MTMAAGQTIFVENEKSNPLFLQRDKMYFLVEGEVELTVNKAGVCVIRSGDLFDEMALITREERVASAMAKTDCELLAINRNVFLDLVCANPKFAVALLGAVGNRARFMAALRK
jgi:cGMP-dependent protein kinase